MRLWPLRRKSAVSMSSVTFAELLAGVLGGGATKSGLSVTSETALQVSAVLACVRVLAEGVAQVPWTLHKRREDRRGRGDEAVDHPLHMLLYRRPNRWQTSFALRETMVIHAALTGNAYCFLSRIGREGRVSEMIVLPPGRVRVDVSTDGEMRYVVTSKGGDQRTIGASDVWHLRGPSWDGRIGMDVLKLAREAIGLAMASEETQANLHKNGVRTTGTYSVDGKLDAGQYEQLKAFITKEFAGSSGPMILDRNAKWQPTTMTGVDAQHLETRRHQVEEICRVFRVLPVMVMQQDKAATYASAEQMFIAHLVHTLMPWFERLEQSADCALLTDEELRAGYYTLLEGSGLLRGALKDTAEYLAKLVQLGVITRNEARAFLDRNPIDGLDEPMTPMNMITSAENNPQEVTA